MSSSTAADDEMIREFSTEATDMLDQAETDLLSLDKGGDFKSRFDSIFRVFHSLKGGAGMLGLLALQKHMHALENTLSGMKSRQSLTSDEINYFLEGMDAGRKLLAGDTVNFNYTLADAPAATTPAPATAPPVVRTKRPKQALAYVVDDEADILESLCLILEEGGIESRSFTNPLEALEEIKKAPPDIVLTDMKMPQMSGLDLLQQIRLVNPDLPVILISGYMTTESLVDAIQSDIFAAIEKPFKVDVVLTYALAAIRQHQTFKMFRRGLNLLLYQFADLEDFLKSQGKEDAAKAARTELTTLLAQWKTLSANKPKPGPATTA